VSQGLPGFSATDSKNNWRGIDVDYCKAVAAAILKDANKVKFTPLSSKERFTALQSGEVDLLSRNTTYTLSRDSALGIDFVGVTYFDGQGIMVRKDLGVKSATELDGATICVNAGTTTELNIADYFRSNGMKYKLVSFEKTDEVVAAYDAGRCDVYTTDQSGLYAQRIKLKDKSKHIVLSEVISKEPLGPAVRHGDNAFADISRWVLYAIIEAEELGVTTKNLNKMMKSSKNPNLKRLFGIEGDMGAKLGLDKKWAVRVVKSVGNYGEMFERNLGKNTTLGISRGINQLWTKGGLQYAMPIR
jgi:general L-amino acid transport system substrate-binding protein